MNRAPQATVARLVLYLRALEGLQASGEGHTNSRRLAALAGVTAAQLRKDLSYFGRFGRPGSGYGVPELSAALQEVLGTAEQERRVVILGMGRLGQALAHYPAIGQAFRYVGFFDTDPALLGRGVAGLRIAHPRGLPAHARRHGAELALITVPAGQAQGAAQLAVEGGVRGLLNFAPVRLTPRYSHGELCEEWRGVHIEDVDVLVGLRRLAFHLHQEET